MPTYRVTTAFVVRQDEDVEADSSLMAARRSYRRMYEDANVEVANIERFAVVELDENGHEKQRTKTVFSKNFVEVPF